MPTVSSLPGVVVLVLVNLPLTLSDKIFSLNLGTALISSSVSMPMSATVPGPIVETSLPSTVGRASRCVSTRHGGSVTVVVSRLPCTHAPVTFCSTARIALATWRWCCSWPGGSEASCGEEVKVQQPGGRRLFQEKAAATTLPPAASCRVRHTS